MNNILLRFVHISDTHISHDPQYAADKAIQDRKSVV